MVALCGALHVGGGGGGGGGIPTNLFEFFVYTVVGCLIVFQNICSSILNICMTILHTFCR